MKLDKIWVLAAGTSTKESKFKPEQQAVLLILKEVSPKLYRGISPLTISEAELNHLQTKICTRKMLPREAYKRKSFLLKGLKLGEKHLGWILPSLPYRRLIRKENNRVKPEAIQSIIIFRNLEQAFLADLSNTTPETQFKRIGQICISAMMYGGLTHKKWINSLIPALQSKHIYQYDNLLWVDLWAIDKPTKQRDRFISQKAPDKYRRWIVDPTTQLLIYRWIDNFADDQNSPVKFTLWQACQEYLKHIGIRSEKSLNSLAKLLRACQAKNTITIPPFLAEYAENKLISASLPDEIWLRLFTGQNIPTLIVSPEKRTNIHEDISFELKLQLNLLDDLTNILKADKKHHEQVSNFLQSPNNKLCPILLALTDWALQLLSNQESEYEIRSKKGPLKPTSVYKYIQSIGYELITEFKNTSIHNIKTSVLANLLYNVGKKLQNTQIPLVENTPDEHSDSPAYRFRQFYRHLELFFGLPSIDILALLDGVGKKAFRPNANLITFTQYSQVLGNLGWGSNNLSRQEKIALIVVILAFRGGLRCSETMGLEIGDLQGDKELEVLVRRHDDRELKSAAARRRVPLHILLNQAELNYLKAWKIFRSTEPGVTTNHLLFTSGPLSNKMLEIPEQIQICLKSTMMDNTFVVHHLRHCYETWLIIRLLLRTDIKLASLPAFLQETEFDKKNLATLRDYFFNNEPLRRKANYAAAITIGHADVEEGFASYMHLTDWLLGYFLRHQHAAPTLNNKALSKLTDRTISRADQILRNEDNPLLSAIGTLAAKYQEELTHPLIKDQVKTTNRKFPTKKKKQLLNFDDALNLLKQHESQNGSALTMPRATEAKRLIQKYYESFVALETKSQKKYVRIASDISSHLNSDSGIIESDNINEARRIFEFFDTCEINKKQLEVFFHASRGASKKSISKNHKYWSTELSINMKVGKNTQRRTYKGCIRISITDLDDSITKKTDKIRIIKILLELLVISGIDI